MALVLRDRVKETTEVTGTGNAVLTGAPSSFRQFSDVMQDGDTTYYAIYHYTNSLDEFEVGLGTYVSSTDAIERTEVYSGSNGTSKVSFSAGTKNIILTLPAVKSVTDTEAIATAIALGG